MTPIQRLLSTAALSLTVTTAVGCASQPQAAAQPQASSFPNYIEVRNVEQNVITVQSAETVKVVPDMAQISFSVATQEKDAKTCQEKNN